jgi:hypothetical protein
MPPGSAGPHEVCRSAAGRRKSRGHPRDVEVMAIAKSFFRYGKPYNPPCPPLKKGGNYKEVLFKSPFDKGGFRGI